MSATALSSRVGVAARSAWRLKRAVAWCGARARHTAATADTAPSGGASNAGIVGWNVYVPRMFVAQEALERHDGVSAGKYTKGLGQTSMAFADAREDIVSMMLTATQGLLEKSGVHPSQVGRLEVGTETLVDKSKATKTSLMRLFGEDTDIEGVDTINACYGGTNALFNCLHWMGSPAWDGRYAIVVTGDIAVYEAGPARPTGGAGVVAMLVGPDAPLEIDVAAPRATHMEDAYDFYKPDLESEYPRVDGHLSNACYLRAVDRCFQRMAAKHRARVGPDGPAFDVRDFGSCVFHQPYQRLVQKSYWRYAWNQHRLTGDVDPALDAFLDLPEEETYTNRDLERAAGAAVGDEYTDKVFPSTWLGRECGNMYTGSLYAGLASLVAQGGTALADTQALLFSYGSGLAATMFQAKFRGDAKGACVSPEVAAAALAATGGKAEGQGLAQLASMLQVERLLDDRVEVDPEIYTLTLEGRRKAYGQFPWAVDAPPSPDLVAPGSFYLRAVDEVGRREYARA